MDGADEVVDAGGYGEGLHEGAILRADELCLEGDEDVDLGRVEGLEALGFEEVGFVAGDEAGEGILGAVELFSSFVSLGGLLKEGICM